MKGVLVRSLGRDDLKIVFTLGLWRDLTKLDGLEILISFLGQLGIVNSRGRCSIGINY